jgi:hypothetical protein
MIALVHLEKQSLQAVFPEQCLKATSDLELLSNVYDFDISMCPHQPWVAKTSHVTQIFTELFDSVNSRSRVPELLVWMQGQVRRIVIILFTFIDTYIYRNILIARMTSLRTTCHLSTSGFKKHYLRSQFVTIAISTSLSISLLPQRWWISHNFLTYTISYRGFWI